MNFKYLGSSLGCMRIQDMPLTLQYVFKMVSFSGSKHAITGDEVNTILEPVKSCRIPGVQASDGILRRQKRS